MSNISWSLNEHVELPGDTPTIPVCTIDTAFVGRLQGLATIPRYGVAGDIDNINSDDIVEVVELAYSNGIVDGKILLAQELLKMLGI